jgi:hypothetical protein
MCRPLQNRGSRGRKAERLPGDSWPLRICMFGRLSRLTPNGSSCYWEPGSGEPDVTNDAGWPTGAWDDPAHEQPPKGGLTPRAEHDPGTGVRDAAAWWPLSSCCQGSGTLAMSAPALSVSAIVLSVSTGACWNPPSPCAGGGAGLAAGSRGLTDGCTKAELLLCAPVGAVKRQASRSGAPV